MEAVNQTQSAIPPESKAAPAITPTMPHSKTNVPVLVCPMGISARRWFVAAPRLRVVLKHVNRLLVSFRKERLICYSGYGRKLEVLL